MIQANELRIGNYFRGIGGIQTVLSLEENTDRGRFTYSSEEHRLMYSHLILCHQNGNQYKPFEIEPIHLTDKILTDVGGSILPFIKGIILDRFSFFWREDYKYWYVTDHHEGTYITKIEYVHELQNFFKFINGQELNLNLT